MLFLCLATKKLLKSAVCAVASFYYEISDTVLNLPKAQHNYDSKYYVVHSPRTGDALMAGGLWVTQNSERIWREDNSGIHFVKNRFQALGDPIDLKEFMWIKLQAKELKV